MSVWSQWMRQPQSLWLRKAVFQIHLWTGLTLGLYIVMLSITGSILVYRVELNTLFETPRPAFEPSRTPLPTEELTREAQEQYPGWTITRVGSRVTRRNPVIEIWLERNGETRERLFNPYTGEDLGDALPWKFRAVDWVAELHGDLLLDEQGARLNAAGSALITLLAVSGAFVWWPGIRNWRRSVAVRRKSSWIRFNWDLHNAMGFWCLWIVLIWGLSGIYLGWPDPFAQLIDDYSDPQAILGQRPGDIFVSWITRLHFGRFRGAPWLKVIWVPLGLVPAAMFVTGVVMWWNRVLRKRSLDRAA